MMDDNNRWDKDFPEQWERVPLKSKFTFGKGLSIKKTDLTEQGENVISYGQIHAKWNSNVHCHNELLRHVPQTFCNGSDSSIAKRNGFIFADTSEDLDGVGNCAFIDSDKTIYAGYHTVLLTPIEDHDNKYLAYLFTTDTWRYQIRRHLTEVKVFSISQKTLKRTYIVLPPSDIQHAIASFLDRKCAAIDDSIAKHKAIIEKLEEYRKAEITRAVTKGLNPDVKMKESGIPWAGQIPEGWVVIHQKYLAHIFGRIGFRGYTQKDIVDKGEGPITLSPSNMANGKMDYLGCTYLSWDKYDESPEIQIHNNDILMVKTGSSYGKVAWVDCLPMEATINPQIVVLKNITCNPRYLFYYMQSEIYQYQVHKAVVGGTIPTLSQRAMDRYIIIIPSNINEQLDVVHYLDNYTEKIAKAVDKHNQLIAKLEEYKKSLIYNVVTGKIDCREGA